MKKFEIYIYISITLIVVIILVVATIKIVIIVRRRPKRRESVNAIRTQRRLNQRNEKREKLDPYTEAVMQEAINRSQQN